MIRELIVAQQLCFPCQVPTPVIPPPLPPPPACPRPGNVTNPSLCRQSGAAFVVDGCSIPTQITSFLGGANRNNPVAGIVAQASTAFGVEQGTIPAALINQISTLPCNKHDRCYKTCASGRGNCDLAFAEDLRAVCDRAYPFVPDCPTIIPPPSAPSRCLQYRFEATKCSTIAVAMGAAVAVAGQAAYVQNQDRHCDCCNVP